MADQANRVARVAVENACNVRVYGSRFERYSFLELVLAKDWKNAFTCINGESMHYMLRLMATLDPADLRDLMAQAATADGVYMPRIQYAADVVLNRALPATAPGDLAATGQVQDAQDFLANAWLFPYLILPYDLTKTLPDPNPDWVNHRMSDADIAAVAANIGVEVALIQAIKNVESGAPFMPDGRPIVRYELHLFYASQRHGGDTAKAEAYARSHPFLANARPRTWQEGNKYHHYGDPQRQQAIEWSYIYNAMILRPGTDNALKCASFGAHQIMGFNYRRAGASSVLQFVQEIFQSEAKQFECLQTFMLSNPATRDYLRDHEWQQFADTYNGGDSRKNDYAENLKRNYVAITGHE